MHVLGLVSGFAVEALGYILMGTLIGSLIGFLVLAAEGNPPILAGLVGVVVSGVVSYHFD